MCTNIVGDFTLAQTSIICKYLGKEFGLYPACEKDQWHGEQINATVHDYIGEGELYGRYICSCGSSMLYKR